MQSLNFKSSALKLGLLNQKQHKILKLRAKGLTQLEAARELGTSRANVSMIELRARRKIEKARETLAAYESLQSTHKVVIEEGMRLAEIPMLVLHEGDRLHIHVQSDIVKIVRLVRSQRPSCVKNGTLTRSLIVKINEKGKLSVS
ncbi:MAG: Tfx family DNA-binding protein [Nitrososphaerales archaeon]